MEGGCGAGSCKEGEAVGGDTGMVYMSLEFIILWKKMDECAGKWSGGLLKVNKPMIGLFWSRRNESPPFE